MALVVVYGHKLRRQKPLSILFRNSMQKITLNQSKFAIVDDEVFEYLNQFNWTVDVSGYAIRNYPRGTRQYMHRVITQPDKNKVIDHINGNKLDNRMVNLRVCTQKQNTRNRNAININNTTGFMGVIIDKRQPGKPFIARITVNGKLKSGGGFQTAIEAAKKYNELAREYFGKYAFQNEVRS